MLKFTPENSIPPARGKVLLAEPFMEDPYFKRTVVLLCEHNEEGSFGFVLNNYVDVEINRIMDEIPPFETRISIGGPVKNSNLYYIHSLGHKLPDSIEVAKGIYVGGDFALLKEMLNRGEVEFDQLRFFVGYSGWSPKQLEEELERKSWFVTDADPELLMDVHETDLWGAIIRTMGKEFEHLAQLPRDPSLN
ncbi:MAG: hypothetical protein RL226_770 [Bacteroidota bacterium]|jgi:putative transcriptional regulator